MSNAEVPPSADATIAMPLSSLAAAAEPATNADPATSAAPATNADPATDTDPAPLTPGARVTEAIPGGQAPSKPSAVGDADGLMRFIDASPSPYHAVATTAALLEAAGWVRLDEADSWTSGPAAEVAGSGRGYVVREGSIIAWDAGAGRPPARVTPQQADSADHNGDDTAGQQGGDQGGRAHRGAGPATPFRIVGAHTDSPNLRIRPNPDVTRFGWDQLTVEVYGGPLRNSWLDRDLGISGRVTVREAAPPQATTPTATTATAQAADPPADGNNNNAADPAGRPTFGARTTGRVGVRLIRVDQPLLRIPQLAIHLDRATNEGLTLNPQTHLVPVWGATGAAPDFRAYLAELLDVDEGDVLGWDVMTHDLTPSTRLGRVGDLLAAPRLDNLASVYAATCALIAAAGSGSAVSDGSAGSPTRVIVAFDHEEVGSMTNRGGLSQFLPAILERLTLAHGGTRENYLRALSGTVVASADMAHAVHPNYAERYEPDHLPLVNGGPVLKVNSSARYATDATGAAYVRLACRQAGVPLQTFVTRGDLPCGSTIGPMTAALTGAVTVDIGAPMLSMHSARELCGAHDPSMYAAALTAFLAPQ